MALKGKLNILINKNTREYQVMYPVTEASQVLDFDAGMIKAFNENANLKALLSSMTATAANIASAGGTATVTFNTEKTDFTRQSPAVLKYSAGTTGQSLTASYTNDEKLQYDPVAVAVDSTNYMHPVVSTTTGKLTKSTFSFTIDDVEGKLHTSPVFDLSEYSTITSFAPPAA